LRASHGQNRGLAVGAADQAPRACDSAHGLTGKERAISRLVAPGSRVTSEPDPTTVSRSAPFIRSEPCVCRRVRGWDLVLRFRNNVPMASGCIIDFVPPGVDDWLAIDVADEGHQAFPEFVFGGDADVAQH